ncbi:hypothetical protein NECID01_0555 [Nematocida sp. AWRm77]|nr:hypothetical protein NECID01_0555 [Nematocida sp. AWRm77]
MAKIVIVQNIFLLIWACAMVVCGSNFESLGFELTDICADINLDVFYSDHSDILDLRVRDNAQNDARSVRQSVLQEEQALESSCGLDAPALSNTVNTVGGNENSSVSASVSSPSASPPSGISSVQVQPSASNTKRACDTAEKENGEQNSGKRQKTNTTAPTEANSALMDETEVYMAIEEFSRCFGDDAKITSHMSPYMIKFAEYLALRGLTSMHSREIVELCTASEQWRGHNIFWRMLMFFMDTLSLEIVELSQLEDKKTVVLRDRKLRDKSLSEYRKDYIYKAIAKCRDAERVEIECNLNFLEGKGTTDVLSVLRWLLYHVKIECVGIVCDLRETGMTSAMFGRQMAPLSKEWRGCSVRIDSLALHFTCAQYKEAAEIAKECPWITVLKIHFIDTDLCQDDDRKWVLLPLLLHCPALEQLSVFVFGIDIDQIRTITEILPQLVLLEVEFLSLDKLGLSLEEKEESMPVFPGLKTLKIQCLYTYHSDAGIKNLACLFPNLKHMQTPSRYVTTPLIDALSNLRFLRSLETVNGLLPIETAEYLLEKLPALECLSVGVKELGNKLVHALSRCTGMHTLILRGNYTAGFFSSLLQPSPLMSTLKVLCVWRNISISYRNGNFSAEDRHSKKAAMKRFGGVVEMKH